MSNSILLNSVIFLVVEFNGIDFETKHCTNSHLKENDSSLLNFKVFKWTQWWSNLIMNHNFNFLSNNFQTNIFKIVTNTFWLFRLRLEYVRQFMQCIFSGITVVADVPGVGRYLQNHVSVSVPIELTKMKGKNRLTVSSLNEYLAKRTGPMASTGMSQVSST